MSEKEIQEKLEKLLNSEIRNGGKMVRIVRNIATLPKSQLRDDVLRAVGWLNQDVDLLYFRTAGELAKSPSQRSELLIRLISMEADSIEHRLEFVEEMLSQAS